MRHKFVSKYVVILLAFGCMAAFADESEHALLSAEDAAAIKDVVVYISEEQSQASEIRSPFAPSDFGAAPAAGAALGYAVAGGTLGMGIVVGTLAQGMAERTQDDGYAEFPPAGIPTHPAGFENINQSMKDGAFLQSINQIMWTPLEEKTWFENVEISTQDQALTRYKVLKLFLKHQKQKDTDAAVVLRNQFIFGPDRFKLWFITDVEIYDIKASAKSKNGRSKPQPPKHHEKFVSLYDIRDHYEIPNLESKEIKDFLAAEKFANDLWTKDDGKLYFDTVRHLAVENARIVKQFLLKRQPKSVPEKRENSAILAAYKIAKPQEGPRTPKLRRIERRRDAYAMKEMDPIHRKAYMLRREYEYIRFVDVMENTSQRVVACDQDSNTYYSIPRKNLKLVMESEIDPAEYDQFIESPGKELFASKTKGGDNDVAEDSGTSESEQEVEEVASPEE